MNEDQKQLFDFLNEISERAKKDRIIELNNAAKATREIYDAYMNAGFTSKQSFELVKQFTHDAMMNTMQPRK